MNPAIPADIKAEWEAILALDPELSDPGAILPLTEILPPDPDEPRALWCAWCGEWGDHNSGGCADLEAARTTPPAPE